MKVIMTKRYIVIAILNKKNLTVIMISFFAAGFDQGEEKVEPQLVGNQRVKMITVIWCWRGINLTFF